MVFKDEFGNILQPERNKVILFKKKKRNIFPLVIPLGQAQDFQQFSTLDDSRQVTHVYEAIQLGKSNPV